MHKVARDALPAYLSLDALHECIDRALIEDVGFGDVTTLATVPQQTKAKAHFLAKEDGILAGLTVAERVFATIDTALAVRWTLMDGDAVSQGTVFGTVHGRARGILTAERPALNFMQRMSGIATCTRRLVEAVAPYPARILDTRKTVPGLRLLDKWAVHLGGGENHRIGLYDMILIKDNHIAAAGGIPAAVKAARHYRKRRALTCPIEIETRTLEEVQTVLAVGGVDMILLDNMVTQHADGTIDVTLLEKAVTLIDGRMQTEASGNITLHTARAIAATGVDFLSSGALTHSVNALDLSLNIALT